MELLIVIIICLILIGVGRYGSRLCKRLAIHFHHKNETEEYYKTQLLKAVQDLSSTESDKSIEESSIESLVLANKEIMEKRKIQKAMQNELGIPN